MAEPPAGYVRIEGTSRVPVPGAVRVGPSDPNERLSVSIVLRRRPGAPPLPDLSQTGAPVGGHLSREEFAAVYGAAPDDIAQITQFASAHGLSVAETSIARRTVVLAGTVAQMEGAFGVDLGRYEVGEASYRGREGHVHMPAELASLVTGVFGLDNRQQARPALSLATASDQAAQAVSPLTPQQVAQLYNFPAGSAAGQCIGLIEFGGGYYDTDVTAWFASQNLPAPALTVVSVNGATNSPSGNAYSPDGEVILDIDVAGSAAPGAAIAVYFAPWTEDGWVNAVSTAVQDRINKPSVISTSWGYAEGEPEDGLTWTAAAMQHVSTTFAEAAVLGVTVLVASGDAGSDCRIGDGKAHVLYPASDPGVTACGGTTIQDVNAQSFTEALWSNLNGASGGGVSSNFPLPSWQAGINVPPSVNQGASQGRGVPDVAGNADPNSGYYLQYNGSQVGPTGGTSAVAPLYAGLIALINAAGAPKVGYLNPALYQRRGAGTCRDITVGTNGTTTNAFNNAPGYSVGPGWDATTGLGSINGMCLLASLRPQLQHIMRVPDGNWSGFGLIENQELNSPGAFTAISCTGVGSRLSFIGVVGQGELWDTFRSDDGSWQPHFEQIPGTGLPGQLTAISSAGVGSQLSVAGIVGGQPWYATQNADGSWPAFVQIPVTGLPGQLTAISSAGVGSQLSVAGIVGGQPWYATQNADGSWPAFVQIPVTGVIPGTGLPGQLTAISSAAVGSQLYVVGISNGQPWYSSQNVDGSWPAFLPIPVTGLPGQLTAISSAAVGSQLYVVGLGNGQLWYTSQNPNGSWQPWTLVPNQPQNGPGRFTGVGCAGVGSEFQVVGLTPR